MFMTGHISEPADLLRPITLAAKEIAKPIQQNARDHQQYQLLLIQKLAPLLSRLETPLREMRASSPNLDKAATDELGEIARELHDIARSMAAPSLWKRAIFWKQSDCRPVFEEFVSDLSNASAIALSAQPEFADWKASKPHPQFHGELDPQASVEAEKFWAKAERLESLRQELNTKLAAARMSLQVADEFFHEWIRGNGFVKKSNYKKPKE